MADKIFIGRVWDERFGLAKLTLNASDLDLLTQHFKESSDGKVSVIIRESKAGKKYAEIDQWKPSQQSPSAAYQQQRSAPPPVQNTVQQKAGLAESNTEYVDDLPF